MRLIDADELIEHAWRDKLDSRELIAEMIEKAPTIKEISTKIPIDVYEKLISQEPSGDVVSRDVVKEQMIMYGFHAPDMTVTEFVEDLPPVNPKEPTTKNDLGVDAVSRKDVHDMLENLPVTVENKWFNWLQMACMRLADLPSVTPQPRIGHWIDADGDNAICGCCNRLNHLYGAYCKHCGAKMVELQESEET